MKQRSETAEAKTIYGKSYADWGLSAPISYEFSWEDIETKDELVAMKLELTDDEQIKFRNDQRQNKARGVAMLAAYDAAKIVKPTAENDVVVRLKDTVKTLLTAKNKDGSPKYTEAEARAKAAEVIGEDWPE